MPPCGAEIGEQRSPDRALMRVLVSNDGFGDAGGVQTYLDAVVPALAARGHAIAILYLSSDVFGQASAASAGAVAVERISIAERGIDAAMADARAWAPDVSFSHNMRDLDVETRLLDAAPVVKFMHGYFGTCIGGQKMRRWPVLTPCARVLDPGCLALYLPCGCGKRNPVDMIDAYRWATAQRSLFARYAALVVASGHMKNEFIRNGAPAGRVHAVPLFAPDGSNTESESRSPEPVIAFCGRMTKLKGGNILIDAAAEAGRILGRTLRLVMIGDGPSRREWERLAQSRGVSVRFTGWLSGDTLENELRGATLLAIPSTWPEPFGLVGLEAGRLGVPAVAFDVGGIREWLRPGQNGYLVPADPPAASAFARVLADAVRDSTGGAMRASTQRIAREMTLAGHVDQIERILLTQQVEVRR